MGSQIWCKMNTVLADPAKMIAKGAPHVMHNDKELEVYTNALFQLTALEDPSSAELEAIELLTLLVERYRLGSYAAANHSKWIGGRSVHRYCTPLKISGSAPYRTHPSAELYFHSSALIKSCCGICPSLAIAKESNKFSNCGCASKDTKSQEDACAVSHRISGSHFVN
jgi:hypothetical protein